MIRNLKMKKKEEIGGFIKDFILYQMKRKMKGK